MMTERLHGFPFWLLNFDKEGRPTGPVAIDDFVRDVNAERITDLFIFSHGWNNDRAAAMSLYDRFFGEVSNVLRDQRFPKKRPDARIGVAGVIWPSILWPDDARGASDAGTAAGGPAGGGAVGLEAAPPV